MPLPSLYQTLSKLKHYKMQLKAIETNKAGAPNEGFLQNTLLFFYKDIFCKNIEAEICEILRIF